MTTLQKSQIITHITHSLPYTPFDVKWIPCSAKFIIVGQHPRGTGAISIYQLSSQSIQLVSESEKPNAFKCSTLGASSLSSRQFMTGDFNGNLDTWDIETNKNVVSINAHDQIINAIDGCGGVGVNSGPPEVATASRDGCVKVWDIRQKDKAVVTISPIHGEKIHDAWSVAFGNSYDEHERVLAAGYDNGDVKCFDLRNMKLFWETNVKNGVCSIEFDRKDIKMNKMIVAGLESSFKIFDMRTQHPQEGFASVTEKASGTTTVWAAKHLPQNRDIFITSGGSGNLTLYKYNYPSKRTIKDSDQKHDVGVAGSIEMIQKATVAEQPVCAFDWSADKQGLCVFTAFDQAVRVGIVTKLNI